MVQPGYRHSCHVCAQVWRRAILLHVCLLGSGHLSGFLLQPGGGDLEHQTLKIQKNDRRQRKTILFNITMQTRKAEDEILKITVQDKNFPALSGQTFECFLSATSQSGIKITGCFFLTLISVTK